MSNVPPEAPAPDDLLAEGNRARGLLREPSGVRATVDGIRLVNDAILAHVLFALWDSGFYEFSLSHPAFTAAEVADALQLEPTVLTCLLDHLLGRGILRAEGELLQLTEHGAAMSNMLVQGTLNLYVGGYGSLLAGLGPLLRKEIDLSDPSLVRSGRHTGVGSEQLTCVNVVPTVLNVLRKRRLEKILDLGCGAGGFLIQLARTEPSIRGIGVDMSGEAIREARRNAQRFGVSDRLDFVQAEVGSGPLPVTEEALRDCQAVTAMYLLHEFGRGGRGRIVEVLRSIQSLLPDRLFLFTECFPAEPRNLATEAPTTFSQLDYLLIHPLSRQGPPLPLEEWESMLQEAGMKLVELRRIHWIGFYIAST